jgi:hypothetical protein
LSALPWKTCPAIPLKILAAAVALTASLELAAAALKHPNEVSTHLPTENGKSVNKNTHRIRGGD